MKLTLSAGSKEPALISIMLEELLCIFHTISPLHLDTMCPPVQLYRTSLKKSSYTEQDTSSTQFSHKAHHGLRCLCVTEGADNVPSHFFLQFFYVFFNMATVLTDGLRNLGSMERELCLCFLTFFP